jgi:D-beta-D-heptose 7-phosphate kinase / D-beta-D-heptose 1-phosphate adenosyltransferase
METLPDLSKANVLVIGDVMLDRYWWGSVERISPEAPVPIVHLERMSLVAGGAANVASNIAGLGATPFLFGITGDDDEARMLPAVLAECGLNDHFLTSIADRRTTIKTRIVAHHQHVVRIDNETISPIADADVTRVLSKVFEHLPKVGAVVISDYAKGLLTDSLLRSLIEEAREIGAMILVDPKGRDFGRYRGATVLTPNKREAAEACRLDSNADDVVYRAGETLLAELDLDALLITEGENGMTLFSRVGEVTHFDSLARDVFDVTGAGDTVIATFAAAAAAGQSFLEAAKLANVAAGLVVGSVGTTSITREMIAEYMSSDHYIQYAAS